MAPTFANTQMILLAIPQSSNIEELSTKEGKTWSTVLHLLKEQPGFKRLYWGRQVERPGNVELHIVRETVLQHYGFLASASYEHLKKLTEEIATGEPTVRHAILREFTPGCKALGKGAPVTGTAVYLATDEAWDAAWALWATIVPNVHGCLGVAGGYIIEPVHGHERCFIAWVGWENVEVHDAYHHTEHFRDRRIILQQGNKGYREYGHVAFHSEALLANL